MSRDLAALTAEDFVPFTGQIFRMASSAGFCQDVELLKVRPSLHRVPKGFRQPFAVEFRSALGEAQPQGIYLFSHSSAGDFEIMVTPVQSSERGVCYEAIFA